MGITLTIDWEVGLAMLCRARLAGLVMMACALLACGDGTGPGNPPKGLTSCQGNEFLTVAPVDPGLLREIVPLGSLSPPAHTLPTDHVYMNTTVVGGTSSVANLMAPGNIVLVEVSRQTRSGGSPNDGVNYGIRFYPCADVFMYFSHLVSLSTDLAARVGTMNNCDPPSTSGGITSTECRKTVDIRLAAGTLIGTIGGRTFPGVDYGGADRRVQQLAFVNPARSYGNNQPFGQNRTICPIDYYVPVIANALRAKLGRNGVTRTIAPVCGTIMQDVANTAQGRWYFSNAVQDDPHLALAHDNSDPRIGVISAGTSVPSIQVGAWGFTPATSGRVNTDFSLVSDSQIYCYQNFTPIGPPPLRHILVQLVAPTRVRIEGITGASCGDPGTWAFGAGAREFIR